MSAQQPPTIQIPKIVVEKLLNGLREHPELKQREGLLKLPQPEPVTGEQTKKLEFFRLKRMIRAIQSDEFSTMLKENEDLMKQLSNKTRDDCIKIIVLILNLKLITPVLKPSHQILKNEFGTKPHKELPTLLPITAEIVETVKKSSELKIEEVMIDFANPEKSDNRYFCWNIESVSKHKKGSKEVKLGNSLWDKLKIVLIIFIGITLVLYPVWPYKMRVGVYYLSYGVLGLLGAFFALAVLRLLLYLLSYPVLKAKGGLWIFPNLFEDCGFIESFKPIYGFGELNTYSYLNKLKKQKNKEMKLMKQQIKETSVKKGE
ncbi:hypothetical protein QEN19_002006 [Hanseniaspora menglaensis]